MITSNEGEEKTKNAAWVEQLMDEYAKGFFMRFVAGAMLATCQGRHEALVCSLFERLKAVRSSGLNPMDPKVVTHERRRALSGALR